MNYKLSYYTIFTDELNASEDRVVLGTRTGQALVIKKHIYETIMSDEIETLDAEDLRQLAEAKVIVPFEEDELLTIVSENKEDIDNSESLYEVLQITANCQLGCDYCGQHHTKTNLSVSQYDNLFTRIREKASAKVYKTLYIGWFGGEPLVGLKQMRELTPRLKALAEEFGMTYGAKIVTNGMSLKENIYLELIQDLAINHIEVTLDGIAPFHDTRRITKEGVATFDIIFNNLLKIFNREKFQEDKCGISIRCNVDERNEEGVSPLIKLLADHNLQNKISYFYPIGVYSWSQNDAHKKSLTKEEFAKKEIDWYMELIHYGFSVSLMPHRVKSVCMSVSKSAEVFDAYGNIMTCTEVSYTPVYEKSDYIIGNLKFPTETYSKIRTHANWNDEILEGKFPCHSCKMLPVCGGACPKSWHEDMRACPPNKFNIKEKLTLSYIVANAQGDLQDLLAEEIVSI